MARIAAQICTELTETHKNYDKKNVLLVLPIKKVKNTLA